MPIEICTLTSSSSSPSHLLTTTGFGAVGTTTTGSSASFSGKVRKFLYTTIECIYHHFFACDFRTEKNICYIKCCFCGLFLPQSSSMFTKHSLAMRLIRKLIKSNFNTNLRDSTQKSRITKSKCENAFSHRVKLCVAFGIRTFCRCLV